MTIALPGTEPASARLLRQFGGAAAIPSRLFSDTESRVASFVRAWMAKGTVVHANEAAFWDKEAYSLDGARTNMAEGYFCRLRRAEIDIGRHIPGADLLRHAGALSFEKTRS